MPAFDKNSVQIDYAYIINPIESEDEPVQACPRCGLPAPRRHRSVCFSCKRRIPPTGSRQGWEAGPKNPFELVSPLVQREKPSRECKFKLVKTKKAEILRVLRKSAVPLLLLAAVAYAVPYAGTAILGEAGMNQIKGQMAEVINDAPQYVASAVGHSN